MRIRDLRGIACNREFGEMNDVSVYTRAIQDVRGETSGMWRKANELFFEATSDTHF